MKMTIKKQLVIALLVVGILPFVVMGVTSFIKASDSLNSEAISKLEMARDLKALALKTYFDGIRRNIKAISENRNIHNILDELVVLQKKYNVKANGSFNITDKQDVQGVYAKYDDYFQKVMKDNRLYDIFLITGAEGHVVYTVAKESDLGENVKTGSLRSSGLGEVWMTAVKDREEHLTDMAPYAPSNGDPAMFMGFPIVENGEVEAVVVVQIDPGDINNIMQERTGMGESGETYLVGRDKLMRSDSFLDPTNHSLKASFKNPSVGSVNTEAVTETLAGKNGTKIIADYNNNSVLSSYKMFEFLDIKWAIIAEIDEVEIFATVYELRNNAAIMGAVFLAIIIAIALLLGRMISAPIILSVESIIAANTQVVSAAGEISESSQSLAEGASQQASSIEEVSATVEESTAINTQNADNAREADILAKDTQSAATDGYSKGSELMNAMNEINSSSARISKIIKTIDEIASQTKLLALNAAVEAARAGEHGLGFAVVADEVKSLAERSANAATETSTIIEESINQVKKGLDIAGKTSEAFGEILDKIKKTANLIGEISISSKEQSEGMNQIGVAMGGIDQVTQQNAATSEEAAAAAEELNAQAVSMMEMVGDIAAMVGLDTNVQRGGGAQKRQSAKAAPRALASKPKAKPAAKLSHRSGSDDIFPLDEDDLKEF